MICRGRAFTMERDSGEGYLADLLVEDEVLVELKTRQSTGRCASDAMH